jgi:hypothetical protein
VGGKSNRGSLVAAFNGAATIQPMRKRSPLPDFGIFFDTDNPSPIDFTCRQPPNFFHDLAFLSSYVHDARVRIRDVRLRGEKLQIPLQRDRWERYESLGNLECIYSLLTISPVLSIRWESNGKMTRPHNLPRDAEFRIRYVFLGESYWDDSDEGEIVFNSYGKRPSMLRIIVQEPFFIRLEDRASGRAKKK